MAVLAAVMTQDVPPPRNAGPLAPVLTGLLERDPVRRLSGDRAEEALKAIASGHAAGLAAAQLASSEATSVDPAAGAAAEPATTHEAAAPPPVPGPVPGLTAQYPPGQGGQWTPGYAPPAPPAASGTKRRRSVVPPILAGVVVATAMLAAAGFLLWPDGTSGGEPGASRQPTTVAKQSTPDTPTTPATSPATSPASSGGPDRTPLPDGLVRAGGPGFTIGVPRGWQPTVRGNSTIWTDPASSAYVQVDRTPWSGDPYEHWLVWERQAIADGKLADFNRISITRTTVAGVDAADIEFTWTRSDGLTRARDRGVIYQGRPYAVVVAVPASQWNENEALVNNVLDTFRPSGVG